MTKAEIKALAEKEAGSVKNWITEDDRNHFFDGYIKAYEHFIKKYEPTK